MMTNGERLLIIFLILVFVVVCAVTGYDPTCSHPTNSTQIISKCFWP